MQVEQRLDRLLLHPLWGYVIALLVFYAGCILFVGGFWAGWVVDVLDQIYQSTMGPWLVAATASIPWPWVGRLLWGEFGLVALGLRYAVMIILPIVTGFFCVFSLLEDSGYLPRLAALTDRLLRPLGLGGSAAMPLVLGLGCTTMATVFTRILPAARDRTITILLLALVVPCSAQMGVITGLLSRFPVALLIWGGTIGVVAVIAARVASIFSGGSSPPLVQELPPLRTPRAKNVAAKVFSRVKWYGVEVLPLLLIVCAGAWLLDEAGIMSLFERGAVVLAGFARLPPDVAPALMLGFFRRDYGAAGLFAIRDQLTVAELCVACILLTLLFPCVAQFVVMVRERGVGMGIGMAVAVFVTAVVVASLMGWLLIGGL